MFEACCSFCRARLHDYGGGVRELGSGPCWRRYFLLDLDEERRRDVSVYREPFGQLRRGFGLRLEAAEVERFI